MFVTAGVYSLSDFEVTPSAIIGFLTVLSYSLYDTVVVFDKIRENTADLQASTRRTFAEEVNLAVNQTLVRSINTMMVAILPVGAILFIGAGLLGAGTLRDLSLALFVGILIGTAATIFVAAPLYAWLRQGEPELIKQAKRVEQRRADSAAKTAPAGKPRLSLTCAGVPGWRSSTVTLASPSPYPAGYRSIRQRNRLEELTGCGRCFSGRTFEAGAGGTGGSGPRPKVPRPVWWLPDATHGPVPVDNSGRPAHFPGPP